MTNKKNMEITFFIILFVILFYLLYQLFTPLFGVILFGAILAGSFLPLHTRVRKLRLSDHWSAVITCSIITIGFVLPALYIAIQVSNEVIILFGKIKVFIETGQVEILLQKDHFLIHALKKGLMLFEIQPNVIEINQKLLELGQSFTGRFITYLNSFLGNLVNFIFNFIITILTTYAFFAQGKSLKKYIFTLSPLPEEQEELLLERFNQMNYVSFVCNGLGGVIQGGLAGIGFILAGIGSPFLWTALMVILAFVPLVGISVVSIPASLYIIIMEGNTSSGIALLVYCGFIAFITENWFKPKFIGDRIKINSLFVLFAIVGGLIVHGLPGVFYGPIIGILFITAASIFQEHYADQY